MPTVTFEDLVTPMTEEAILTGVALPLFQTAGFDTDTWGPTDEPYATVRVETLTLASLSTTITNTARMATNAAVGAWKTLRAKEVFGLDREAALPTVGTITLTDSSGSPQTFAAGDLIVVSSVDADVVFTVPGVTVPAGGSVAVTITAEQPGVSHNIDAANLQLATPVAGLALTATAALGWITQTGTDEESDDRLGARMQVALADLSETPSGEDAYRKWALESSSQINRVYVQTNATAVPPAKPVTVYLAGVTGPVPAAALAAAVAYIDERHVLGIEVEVVNAPAWTLYLRGEVRYQAAHTTAPATVLANLAKYVSGEPLLVRSTDASTLPGLGIYENPTLAQVAEVAMAVDGVTDVRLEDGAGVALPSGYAWPSSGVATLDTSLLVFTAV